MSYLYHTYGDTLENLDLPLFSAIEKISIRTILQMIKKGINCPHTSSLGRLFDGVSALLGIRYRSSYEGQAAMELETAIDGNGEEPFPYEFHKAGGGYRIGISPIIGGVVDAIQNGAAPGTVSCRFHQTLICLFEELCDRLRREIGIKKAVLSGGVFQNAVLLEQLKTALTYRGMRVYTHAQVPCNDGGISLGQAAVVAACDRSGEN